MSPWIRLVVCFACLAACASAQTKVPLIDFECQTAGTLVPIGSPDCEGWESFGGTQVIMPDGVFVTAPCVLPLDGSAQWCEVSPNGVGPADPAGPATSVPPMTPGVWPFDPGTVSEMRLLTTVPTSSTGVLLRLDWYWFSGELPSSVPWNDFAQILLIDPATNAVISTVMYVDTFPPNLPFVNPCPSGVTNITYSTSYAGPQITTVPVPPAYHGQPLIISVVAANQGDDNFDSVLYVDHLRWILPAAPTVALNLVSVGPNKQGNEDSDRPSISSAGRYVAFESEATNLVTGDTNGDTDVFVHDQQTGLTERVSIDSLGAQLAEDSMRPSISGNGRWVVFESEACVGTCTDSGASSQIYLHDRQTGQTTRLTVASGGGLPNGSSSHAVISEDGTCVAFQSSASNLVPGDNNCRTDVFVVELASGTIEIVSLGPLSVPANAKSEEPAISLDGRFVAFQSLASNLIQADGNKHQDIFLRDRLLGTTELVSLSTAGLQGSNHSDAPAISGGGRFIAFESRASDLVPNDTNACRDIFVRDTLLSTTIRASVSSLGAQGSQKSTECWLSSLGRYVTFESKAENLVIEDNNDADDVFVHDLWTGETTRISINQSGVEGNHKSWHPVISHDGTSVAFASKASNFTGVADGDDQQVFVGSNQ